MDKKWIVALVVVAASVCLLPVAVAGLVVAVWCIMPNSPQAPDAAGEPVPVAAPEAPAGAPGK